MDLNEELLKRFPQEEHVLLSADSVELEDEAMNEYQPYSVEYLNSLVSSSLPLAHLKLKIGCPVMLLRNSDASKGLCNGTRLMVLAIRRRVLKCRKVVFIRGSHCHQLQRTCQFHPEEGNFQFNWHLL